mgnify:CR=1
MSELTVKEFQSKGGKTTLKKHGKEHFQRISALGVAARKKNKKSPEISK